MAFKGSQATSRAPLCGAYRGTGAQRKIKAPSSCRIGADVGPVAGSLILGRGAPLAGSWTKDARSRRHGPGSGAQGGPSGKVKGGGAVFGAMPLQRVRPHRGIVSFWPHVQS